MNDSNSQKRKGEKLSFFFLPSVQVIQVCNRHMIVCRKTTKNRPPKTFVPYCFSVWVAMKIDDLNLPNFLSFVFMSFRLIFLGLRRRKEVVT